MLGTILNIQRFSTHDGPGIRTVVFLKGCTNACAWCHNPEAMRAQPELQVYPDRCILCGRCVEVCPKHAHRIALGAKAFDRDLCRMCGLCSQECFSGALVTAGRTVSDDDLFAEIVKDEAYYSRSGGGVTLSGGEPVLQGDFVGDVLRRCRERGIHTAIETAGNYPWEAIESLLPYLDLVMCDLKASDPEIHLRYVGVRPDRIRENLRRLAASGVHLIVRTPVVGGANDTEQEIGGIARFLSEIGGSVSYELLRYHRLGNAKRESLGLLAEAGFTIPSAQRIGELASVAREFLPDVRP